MANRVLSIEIEQSFTHVAEVDYKTKNPKIYATFTFPTPPDMINDGVVSSSVVFKTQLLAKLKENGVQTKRAIFVLNSARIANRTITIPNVKENRIADMLNANASDYFPVDLEQYTLTHEVLGRVEDGDEKKIQLGVLAIPKDMISAYEALAEDCGLTLEGMDYIGSSIKKMMNREIPEALKVTVKISESSSIITIVENGEVQLQRSVNYGVYDMLDSIVACRAFGANMTPIDALEVAKRTRVMNTKLDEAGAVSSDDASEANVDKAKLQALRDNVTEDLRPLIGSISRIIDYYQSSHADKTIEKIYLVGIGAVCSGLSKLMTNELNYKVVSSRQYDNAAVRNAKDEAINVAEYFANIGATIEPVSLVSAAKKKKEEEKQDSYVGAIIITCVCIAGAVALAVLGFLQLTAAKVENSYLNSRIESLQYAEEIYLTYQKTESNYNWALSVEDSVDSPNNELVAFIEELEQKMPSEIIVFTLNASRGGVSMNIQVNSKEAAADVIAQLRTFDSVIVNAVSTISDSQDDFGMSTVAFSVDLSYVEPVEE